MLRVFVVLVLSASLVRAEQPPLRSVKNWEVRGPSDKITWVELHDVDPADPSVIHVEVLSRRKADDSSEIHHLCAHLAITLDALQRSVVRPLGDKRGVYPESFEFAHNRWQKQAAAGK